MSLSGKQRKFARMVTRLLAYAHLHPHVSLIISEVWRPQVVQDYYVAQGKSWTRRSKHTQKLAVDLFLFLDDNLTWNPKDYEFLGEYWEKIGGEWGGRWRSRDAVHFQYKE